MNLTGINRFNFGSDMPGKPLVTRHGPLIVGCGIILVALGVLFAPVCRRFAVIEEKTGRLVYCCKIKPGDFFQITYTHSVNKTAVDEFFKIEADYGILLTKTAFRSFGAGIPYEIEPGQKLTVYPDRTEISGLNLRIPKLLLKVGVIADHKLIVNRRTLPLKQLTRPQRTIRLEVLRVPLISLLRGDLGEKRK